MVEQMLDKEQLTDKIVELELEMFLTVPTKQKAGCQEDPDSFILMRKSQFSPWTQDTLSSYLKDLQDGKKANRNLMTEKYARMDNLIPQKNFNPAIAKVVEIQKKWQKDMIERYPKIMMKGRPMSSSEDTQYWTSFETYLRCELETYSGKTLELLHRHLSEKVAGNENVTEGIYLQMVKGYGYESLEHAEEKS